MMDLTVAQGLVTVVQDPTTAILSKQIPNVLKTKIVQQRIPGAATRAFALLVLGNVTMVNAHQMLIVDEDNAALLGGIVKTPQAHFVPQLQKYQQLHKGLQLNKI